MELPKQRNCIPVGMTVKMHQSKQSVKDANNLSGVFINLPRYINKTQQLILEMATRQIKSKISPSYNNEASLW